MEEAFVLELCDLIMREGLDIQFEIGGADARKLTSPVIDALVTTGLIRIFIAIKSGSEYIRNKVMRKGLRTDHIYNAVDRCARYKHLYISSYFIIGMPQETEETLEETFNMISRLPLDSFAIFFATPYPGTELFNYCLQYEMLEGSFEDYMENPNIFHKNDVSILPYFKPHKLTKNQLIQFRDRCIDFRESRRIKAGAKPGFPIRLVE